jgi:hypothetical protein
MTKLAIVTLVLAAACGKGDGKGGAGKGGTGGEVTAEHVAAVNAALPADLKSKVEFEAGKIIENEKRNRAYKAAVPKGWKKGFMPGSLQPADSDNFGSKTLGKNEIRVDRNCDGTCEKKDWAAVSEKVLFSQFAGGKMEGKLVKDEKRTNGRLLVFEPKLSDAFPDKQVAVYIINAWWDPEASEYHTCQVQLGAPLKDAAAAFEKACSVVVQE